jgi:hypothetical protein
MTLQTRRLLFFFLFTDKTPARGLHSQYTKITVYILLPSLFLQADDIMILLQTDVAWMRFLPPTSTKTRYHRMYHTLK